MNAESTSSERTLSSLLSSPSQAEEGCCDRQPYRLTPHTSSLPDWLYILSFSDPVPSPFRHPKQFINNPRVLYFVGTINACISGVGLPAFDIVTGWWTNYVKDDTMPGSLVLQRGSQAGYIMTIIGVVYLICFTLMMTCFTTAGVKLSGAVRERYLASIMVQDQAFFDRVGAGEVVSRSSKDIDSIRIGLGERLGYLIWGSSTIIAAFVSAFVHAPKLAGVLFALIPFTMILFSALGWWSDKTQEQRAPMDGQASSFIEQMISSVRVVQSFNMGNHLLAKLEYTMLKPLRKLSTRVAIAKGLELAAGYGAGFLVYSMCFWYGGISVAAGVSVGDVLTVFYNYVNLFFSFAAIVPHLIATTTALQNLSSLRLQIERMPPIDVRNPGGYKPDVYDPSFELDKVTFAYPARPGHKALNDVSVTMEAGKFTAFAGPSGSGKSTAASLLLRLYDPKVLSADVDTKIIGKDADAPEKAPEKDESVEGAGVVRFAGYDVRDLNLTWLRSQVAVVLQNPQLISGTVFDNVVIGLTGTPLEYRADDKGAKADLRLAEITERVEVALRMAQAWDFVCELPNGLHTVVFGGRTGVLSGGQVQRVALARALVRQPKCLLLDEATSAVSADAELKIQEALIEEQKRTGMTLIVIAHRLSTIVAADKIVVMKEGRPVASGTYDQLVDPSFPDPTFRDMAEASTRPKTSKTPLSQTSTQALQDASIPTVKQISTLEIDQPLPPPMRKTSQAFSHVKYFLTVATVLGMAAGAAFVIAAWLHGRAVAALSIPEIPLMRSVVDRWALWFLILAIGTFAVMFVHVFGLESSGENIVSEFRRESARALIRQDIPFFESEAGGSGTLTAQAAHHPQNVGAVVGVVMSQFITSLSNLIATLIMAFILTWRLAVMAVPALALTIILGYLNLQWLQRFEKDITVEDEKQANYVADAVNAAQLNASLTREAEVLRQYNVRFTNRVYNKRWLVLASSALAGTQAMLEFFGGLLFWWGAKQRVEGKVSPADLFTVLESVVVAVYISAKILTYGGDLTRMRHSLQAMQAWFDRVPQGSDQVGASSVVEKEPGFLLRGVQLRYPSRPDVLALKGVDVHLEPGRSYAFCGTSGAGKSSILALLQRFYTPSAGTISLDGVDIRAMDVHDLRSQMGYVSQEPILFEGTIRWNLIAGALDPSTVTQADLEEACEQACILDFIRSLPDGFETDLGMKGGRLSGGQRQRLCIARALLRKPRILLLDEATSALDGQSEAHVQRALDNASKGRLTITIGHRLSAIRGADVIFLMDQGTVVETGNHDELVERRGKYFELIQAQL